MNQIYFDLNWLFSTVVLRKTLKCVFELKQEVGLNRIMVIKTEKTPKMPYKGIPVVSNLFRKRIDVSIKFASLEDNIKILDVGCKDGFLLKSIRNDNQSCKCYGIDINLEFFKAIENCDVRKADVTNLPFEHNYFDIVFVLDILEHVKELDKAIEEINRVLKIYGHVILSGPTETWFYRLCRLFYRRMIDNEQHILTIYDIEKRFQEKGFQLMNQKSLPGFPIPELFRISKFKKTKKAEIRHNSV